MNTSFEQAIWPSSIGLLYEEKHELQSAINSRICALKKIRKELHPRFVQGDLTGQQYLSGRNALNLKINKLHGIKTKLGILEGFGQYSKGKNAS